MVVKWNKRGVVFFRFFKTPSPAAYLTPLYSPVFIPHNNQFCKAYKSAKEASKSATNRPTIKHVAMIIVCLEIFSCTMKRQLINVGFNMWNFIILFKTFFKHWLRFFGLSFFFHNSLFILRPLSLLIKFKKCFRFLCWQYLIHFQNFFYV